eukprot:CAMPEP_0201572972 /NCGR_PEP_ID=MMETSP0190_2-20130828/16567_1 /ASSEMBLY_ACC=CAM_ASM_000263 /TAXON_ID=37353 /ORGANISM="Rosalina sp." /LENGTH=127 /DNA_ID=CAMNT_0047999385 /DNA_START=94 /DNA_END=474 /DNA_ORIENTATION=+
MASAKGNVRPSEDQKAEVTVDENSQLKDGGDGGAGVAAFNDKERFRRIGLNELENVPITLALMAYSVFQPLASNEVNIAMASTFLLGRIMQSVCYAYGLQPWRSIGWMLGVISTLGFVVNIIYGAFK